jgi:hypothetical protein
MAPSQIVVKWGKSNRYTLSMDVQCTPLSLLKATVHQLTQVPLERMKLVFSGGKFSYFLSFNN